MGDVWGLGFGIRGLLMTCGKVDDVPCKQEGEIPPLIRGLGLIFGYCNFCWLLKFLTWGLEF